MKRHPFWWAAPAVIWAAAGLSAPARAEEQPALTDLSIEELAQLEVTTVSRRPEPLATAPAALAIIANQDILRIGATSLPEALRLAPNLDVQRIDARQYAITARGFQGAETANKLLVQIDGRSIYSTLFSGVFWELFEVPVEDIEQIEVISGPGGTLWGINAVNGVVSVQSKDARDTQGLLARATAGNLERTVHLRYGDRIGEAGGFRVYLSGFDRGGFPGEGRRGDLADGGQGLQLGFRGDLALGSGHVTLQGDAFEHDDGTGDAEGQNMLARWTVAHDRGASTQVQAWWSRTARRFLGVYDRLTMAELAVLHNRSIGRHELVLGGGVRLTNDRFVNTLNPFQLDPPSRDLWFWNAFVQDRVELGERLFLTGGVKLEQISYTSVQLLPSVRLAWQVADDHLLWAAISRAVRTPSRIDRQLTAPGILQPGTFRSEALTAFEAGWRGQPTAALSLSVNLFYNLYDDLRTTSPASATMLFPVRLANGLKGETWGVESWGAWQALPWWRLSFGLRTLGKSFRLQAGERDLENGISLGNDPDYSWQLGSRMDLRPDLALDFQLRSYGSRPSPRVESYTDVNARLGWRVSPEVELFVTGTNLFHDRRPESADTDRGQLVRRVVSLGARFGL